MAPTANNPSYDLSVHLSSLSSCDSRTMKFRDEFQIGGRLCHIVHVYCIAKTGRIFLLYDTHTTNSAPETNLSLSV